MIAVRSTEGELIRWISVESAAEFQFSSEYGLISCDSALRRAKMRKQSGMRDVSGKPIFRFQLEKNGSQYHCRSLMNCDVQSVGPKFRVISGAYQFLLAVEPPPLPVSLELLEIKSDSRKNIYLFLAVLGLLSILFFALGQRIESVDNPLAQEEIKPVVVSLAQPTPAAPIPVQAEVSEKEKAQKVVTQNLGFLKTLGKKNIQKAIGGLPQPVLQASPGAGAGGDSGSGGQLLVGLGEGLRKTTVGNSGVEGLGGIQGGKGAGGGQGGYGELGYSGSAGHRLAMVPLAKEASVEGGLDRSLIQATIMRYLNQVRACYEEGLKKAPDLLGKVEMNFVISGRGQVLESRVSRSTLNDPEVGKCIAVKMLTWQFPEPVGNVTVKVNYPFMLRPL